MEAVLREALLEAVRQAMAGDWQAAHLVAQDHEGESLANWLHGIVHRMEGDLDNAAYWYRKCERTLSLNIPTEAELKELEQALSS
jgi:hypothetical protein